MQTLGLYIPYSRGIVIIKCKILINPRKITIVEDSSKETVVE